MKHASLILGPIIIGAAIVWCMNASSGPPPVVGPTLNGASSIDESWSSAAVSSEGSGVERRVPSQADDGVERSGSVSIIDRFTLVPPVGSEWVATSSSLDRVVKWSLSSGEATVIHVSPSIWDVRSLSSGWEVESPRVEVKEGRTTVVFARRILTGAQVLVTDIADIPISGAQLQWTDSDPWDRSKQCWEAWSEAVFSQDNGLAVLEPVPPEGARLRVQATGYLSRTVSLTSGDALQEVRLQRSASKATLEVRSSEFGERIAKPWACTSDGPVLLSPARHGAFVFELPRRTNFSMYIGADGWCPCKVRIISEKASYTVVLARESRVKVKNTSVADAVVWPRMSRRAPGSCAWLPSALVLPADSETYVSAPRFSELGVVALNSHGMRAATSLPLTEPEHELVLEFYRGESMRLRAISEQGVAVNSLDVRVNYSNGSHLSLWAQEGAVSVPEVLEIQNMRIGATGYESVSLDREAGAGAGLSRDVGLVLRRSYDVEIRLVDEQGGPVAGLEVRVVSAGSSSGQALLGASGAESLRGWRVQRSPLVGIIADGDGRIRHTLPQGRFRAYVDVPLSVRRVVEHSGYSVQSHTFSVHADEKVELRVAGVNRFVVEVSNQLSGHPMESVTIGLGRGRATISRKGANHVLWLSDDVEELAVSAPGFLPEVVSVTDLSYAAVQLIPARPLLMRLNAPEGVKLSGMRVTVLIYDSDDAEREDILWQKVVGVSSTKATELLVPLPPPLQIVIADAADRARIGPSHRVWDGVSEVVFEVEAVR